jgi:HK97 family phage major capsid protein
MKILILRKRHKKMLEDAAALRSQIAGFATREADVAAQVEAANTDEEIAAAAEAVAELESAQKSAKERLATIISEAEAIQQEIEDAEAAAAAAAGASASGGTEDRSRRNSGASFQRRCQEFQRTGRMTYEDARSMVKRAALTTSGTVGPTGVSGINDAAGNTVSGFIDLIKMVDATGMAAYKAAYMIADPVAASRTEASAPSESEPTFGAVTLMPNLKGVLSYISKEIRKQSPLQYEQKVNESITRALRRVLSNMAITKILASGLNTALNVTAASGAELFTPHLLSDIILAYGGDEGVDGAAVLVLPKADLKAFAAVRGTNEHLPVYSIVPDSANPSMGVIKDNNGLSCRYCLNKDVPALSTATLSGTAKKGMFYGNPQCAELALWGGVDVNVNDGYKFAEGLLTVMGEVTADADVTTQNGFVVVSAKSA